LNRYGAAATLLAGSAFVLSAVLTVPADSKPPVRIQSHQVAPAEAQPIANDARDAVAIFVRSLSAGDADTVWKYATEEDQDYFATEPAVLHAFAKVFPTLASAKDITFQHVSGAADSPSVQLGIVDQDGSKWHASFEMWLDDAGDWKILGCKVAPASEGVV
jgi:hypothetical protein